MVLAHVLARGSELTFCSHTNFRSMVISPKATLLFHNEHTQEQNLETQRTQKPTEKDLHLTREASGSTKSK
jgi:hypothetical protein